MSKSELIVLGFLDYKPMHGYKIKKMIERHKLLSHGGIKMSSIYKAINRLEKRDHIEGKKEQKSNNPPRSVFHITTQGKNYLREMVRTYLQKQPGPFSEFWLAVAFIDGNVTRDKFCEFMDERIEELKEILEDHEDLVKKVSEEEGDTPSFNIRNLMKMGCNMKENALKTLKQLRSDASKPENENVFLQKEG